MTFEWSLKFLSLHTFSFSARKQTYDFDKNDVLSAASCSWPSGFLVARDGDKQLTPHQKILDLSLCMLSRWLCHSDLCYSVRCGVAILMWWVIWQSYMYQWAMTFHCRSVHSDLLYFCITVLCMHRMTVSSFANKFLWSCWQRHLVGQLHRQSTQSLGLS